MQPVAKATIEPRAALTAALEAARTIIVGKDRQLRLALACLLARGHLLIEDLPGVGKTTLAHTLARVLGLEHKRVQFTSDLLPADILGVSIYQTDTQRFHFHPGPAFTQLLLADEINRATPKTQSALLEAMEERQITADGATLKLPEPFFVIATQNPQHLVGTFALPESQLDRFLMRIALGFPDRQAERTLLKGRDRRELLLALAPVLDGPTLLLLQQQVARLHVADALLDYVQNLLAATRSDPALGGGLSPRAGLSLLAGARAWAFLEGRHLVLPEDVQAVALPVMGHRLHGNDDVTARVTRLLQEVAVP